MTNGQIKEKLNISLEQLLKNDAHLIEHDLSERSITHKLAEHLQYEFGDFHVDCEYNRNLDAQKEVYLIQNELSEILIRKFKERLEHLDADDFLAVSTYPDIIIHIRNSNEHNLLILEVKKTDSKVPFDWDDQKLRAFTDKSSDNPYHYQLGVFIEIKTGNSLVEWPKLTWYSNSNE